MLILSSIMPNGMFRKTPAIVVMERIRPVRNAFPVTLFTYIENTGEVTPHPKV